MRAFYEAKEKAKTGSDTLTGYEMDAIGARIIRELHTNTYDEAAGSPEHGIAPNTPWDQVPMNWTCPECGARKDDFEMVQI